MVLDANTQVGDRFSDSKTDVHLFEFHSKTAGFGLLALAITLAGVALLAWYFRRQYKKRLFRGHQQLAINYRGCRCGTASSLLATNPALQMQQQQQSPHQTRANSSASYSGRGGGATTSFGNTLAP
jgi:hypothetical protein